MKKILAGLMIAVLMAGGWPAPGQAQIKQKQALAQEQARAGKAFYQKIDQINQMIEKGKWQEALKKTAALRKTYHQKQWKLQLLGDEGEYEGLNKELDKLDAAIRAKDKTQAKVELAAVRAFVKAIYSL